MMKIMSAEKLAFWATVLLLPTLHNIITITNKSYAPKMRIVDYSI